MYKVDRITESCTKLSYGNLAAWYDNESLEVFASKPPLSNQMLKSKSIIDLAADSPFPDSNRRKHLSRLTINVSKSCNLRCEYCYAEYGKYGQNSSSAEINDITETMVATVRYYHTIDQIQFFGGEPLLAFDKIRAVVLIFGEAYRNKLITKLPRFTVVTNGTLLLKPNIIDFLKDNGFHITVSCDGNEEITNILRPSIKKGISTYKLIIDGITEARNAGLSVAIESTYTSSHQLHNIKVMDIIDHFNNDLSISSVHVSPAAYSEFGDFRPNKEQAQNDFFEAALESSKRLKSSRTGVLESVLEVFENLSKRAAVKGYCPAYTSQLSLDVNGNAYPCFMSMSIGNNNLGSLVNSDWPNNQSKNVYGNYIFQMSEGDLSTKHKVWYDSLLAGCAAADLLSNNRFGQDADAEIHESIIVGSILGLCA
ncbi:radical SAM protein [uncultured Pseudoalteromonas sp.]|uniref:radical SAM protein n=1 Tax=uncultured Pseudoalteromonas sp. TaxID=114053 RepID=UPI000C378ADA|nr:radical SAM protein [uncultured Pseudoalteromonas sp.]MBD55962.1 hypothetical protein [Pseudoalteromonas sp.]|tara:strand:- start:20328 stop:21602 length:1275 start_codon:yes stop_codon:yes gene_type:complete